MSESPAAFSNFNRIWLLTWTTYATWLPGDQRGHVSPKFDRPIPERRNNTVGIAFDSGCRPLEDLAKLKVIGEPIYLCSKQARQLQQQFIETANYRGWTIVTGAIMANHVHLLVGVADDPDPSILLRDFKSYGSRALNRIFGKPQSGTWWTEQGSKRKVTEPHHYKVARQ